MICYYGDVQEFISTSVCMTCKEGEEANLNKIFDHYFGVHPIPHMLPPRSGLRLGQNTTLHWYEIVKEAKARNLPYITVFESDAYPRADSESVLPALLSNIPDDAHFIFWGTLRGSSMNPAEFGKETFKRFGRSLPGSQAVTILEAGYQDIFDLYEEGSEGIDHGMSGKPGAYHCDPNLFLQANITRSAHGMLGYNRSEQIPVG